MSNSKATYKITFNYAGEVKTYYKHAKSEKQALALALREYEGKLHRVRSALWKEIAGNPDKYKVERVTPSRYVEAE